MPNNQIGKNFERQIVADIRKAFKVKKTSECFRTPMSGGHHALPGVDIQMVGWLLKKFPYAIECKTNKKFYAGSVMAGSAMLEEWGAQVLKSAGETKLAPLLVMCEKRIGVYAATLMGPRTKTLRLQAKSYTVFELQGKRWVMFLWPEFLRLSCK